MKNKQTEPNFKIMRECDECGNEDTIDVNTGLCVSCNNKIKGGNQ